MTLSEWLERRTDQDSCYQVLRLIGLVPHHLAMNGEVSTQCRDGSMAYWTRQRPQSLAWTSREEAWEQARANGGLLVLHKRTHGRLT